MGLLDLLQNDGARVGLGLLAAAGPSAQPQSFGQRLMGGLLQADEIKRQQEREKAAQEYRQMQMQQAQIQLAQSQRMAEREKAQDAFRQSIPSPQFQAGLDVLAANGGVTQAGAAKVPKVDPNAQLLHGAMQAGLIDPIQYMTALRKDNSPLITKAGDVARDPVTGRVLWQNDDKDSVDPFVRLLKQSGIDPMSPQGQQYLRQRVQKEATHTPATQVSVNTGQKGLDNTLKLRGDFRSEPVYKAHQEMESAYAQIQQSLKAGTPIGDLAGATKIMKLLDPGSVVRESELGLSMSATGLLDRVQNYASNIISGHKLTPQQRKEFQGLADALIAQSSHLYNTKRSEYGQIAERNGLNVDDVVGAAGVTPGRQSVVKLPGGAMPQAAPNPLDPLGLRGN